MSGTAFHGCVGAVADHLRAPAARALLASIAVLLAWSSVTALWRRLRTALPHLRPRPKRSARKAAKRLGAEAAPLPRPAAPPLFLWLRSFLRYPSSTPVTMLDLIEPR